MWRKIPAIQMLRAAAALAVVVGHAQTEAMVAATAGGIALTPSHLLPWGAGVDLFFVISGFIMVVASEGLFAQPGGARRFLGRRLARIMPLWWLCATLYLVLQILAHRTTGKPLPPPADIGAAYLLWPTDVFGDGFPRPFYTLGWTLEYEMAFYALFAAALILPRGRAVLAATLALVGAAGVGALVMPAAAPLVLVTRPIVLEFAFGMGLALLYRHDVRLPGVARLALGAPALAALGWDGMGLGGAAEHVDHPQRSPPRGDLGPPGGHARRGGRARTSDARHRSRRDRPRFHRARRCVLRVVSDASVRGRHAAARMERAASRHAAGLGASVALAVLLACGVALLVHYGLERPLGAVLRRRRARAGSAVPNPAAAL